MRIIHTADIHLDACFASSRFPSSFGNKRRQSLRDVLRSIVKRAGEWPADALLIAGDLFEHERVSRDTVSFIRREFESIPNVKVFIAPGNHDPYVTHSPYARDDWPDNVVIFQEPNWTSHDVDDKELTVHGFAFDGLDISDNPFGKLEVPIDGRIHVGVGHGSERGHQPPSKDAYAPFDAQDAATEGLAYLALGHFHSTTQIEGDFPTQIYYSGAPEGQSFNETGRHHYLEVEISNGETKVSPVPASDIVYCAHEVSCTGFSTGQQIVDSIRGLPREADTRQIARIRLAGVCPPTVVADLDAIRDAVAGDFEYVDLVDDTEAFEDYEELGQQTTTLGLFIGRMNEELNNVADEGQKRMLHRAREVGLAAYRNYELNVHGLKRD